MKQLRKRRTGLHFRENELKSAINGTIFQWPCSLIFVRSFSLQVADSVQYWPFLDATYTNQIQTNNYKCTIMPFSRIESENQAKIPTKEAGAGRTRMASQ